MEEAKKDADNATDKANEKKNDAQEKDKANTKKAGEDAAGGKKGDVNVGSLNEEL